MCHFGHGENFRAPWANLQGSAQLAAKSRVLFSGQLGTISEVLVRKLRQFDCMQRTDMPMSLMSQEGRKVRMAMKDRFTVTELSALRNDLLQSGMVDSREAGELLQVFLMGRGYGVSPEAAMDAAGRVEMAGCSLPVLERELEGLALVM
jgi:hypothetical protein